jgi:hypothetical protein
VRAGVPGIDERTRADRPQLATALEFAREGDVLVVARLDRLARSMRQLLSTVDGLQARGIGRTDIATNLNKPGLAVIDNIDTLPQHPGNASEDFGGIVKSLGAILSDLG